MGFHGLLLSGGFSSPAVRSFVSDLITRRRYVRADIITTAHPKKEHSRWCRATSEQLEAAGLIVSFVDFDAGEFPGDSADFVYVCGGNTFHLLHSIRAVFDSVRDAIEALCDRGGLYAGSSAGAVIAGPHIASAGEVGSDRNTDRLADLTSFGFIPEHIIPHYRDALDSAVSVFCGRHAVPPESVIRLRDGEGLYVDGGRYKRLGGDCG